MPIQLDAQDLRDLRGMVQRGEVRDASGYGNNVANPKWGATDQAFVRLTDPFFADGAASMRTTMLTPRQISDLVSNQDNNGDGIEEDRPNAFGGTALLTFFGQYFDHGLDFVAKGQPGYSQIGSSTFPISAARANIMPGTGVNPDTIANNGDEVVAQHANTVSPYVDQNQAYGSHNAVTDLLRKWVDDGSGAKQTAYLLGGASDASGRPLLPTLNDIRANYRLMTGGQEITSEDISNFDGTGQALLIDFVPVFSSPGVLDLDAIGHYFVAGDGRANENVMLTTIHTIWERNHNFWVDRIKQQTGNSWTEDEYFEAARMMNIAEYQRVVFTEFATAMAGGLDNDNEHGFQGYDPTVNAAISAEFAHAAYRFGHSMLNETVSYVSPANGQLAEMSLVDAFLKPSTMANLGVDSLMAGAIAVEHQAIDVDVVNALRNQLVGRPLDLAALNIFRGRDTGLAPFNEVRADLYEKTGLASLRPYSGWDDFQSRNGLSNEFMATLKAAYPEGFAAVDLWVGGLAEKPTSGQLGSTFGYIFLEQLQRLQDGDRFYYLEIFDDSLFEGESDVTFADIVMRNTGLTNLPSNIFMQAGRGNPSTPATGKPTLSDSTPTEGQMVTVSLAGVVDPDGIPAVFTAKWQSSADGVSWTDIAGATAAALTPTQAQVGRMLRSTVSFTDNAGNAEQVTSAATAVVGDLITGTSTGQTHNGTAGSDTINALGGDDTLNGGAGADAMNGGAGNDTYIVDDAGDVVIEAAASGTDIVRSSVSHTLAANVENLTLTGTNAISGTGNALANIITGNDAANALSGGDGADVLNGGAGADSMAGGAGADRFVFSGNTGLIASQITTGNSAASRDVISDFVKGQDRIDLSAIDASRTGILDALDNDAFSAPVQGTSFTGAGQLRYFYENGNTIVIGNVNSNLGADFQIQINGIHILTATDFVL